MVSYPSGMLKNEQLLTIKTDDLYLVISGDLDLNRYRQESYKSFIENNDSMYSSTSKNAQVEIFDIQSMKLVERTGQAFLPIFFENGRYEVQVMPLKDKKIQFHHEYEGFKKSVRPVLKTNILSGTLHFQNEVGFSNFEIRDEHGNTLLSVVIEVYPTKLDYKKDYQALLDEVSDIVYNLAYDFLRRTYLTGSEKVYKEPTGVEFYRLLEKNFDDYMKAVNFVEQKPHRRLETTYEEVRGDRLRKQDSVGRAYLRKNASLFVEVEKGIHLNGRQMMPQKGLLIKKVHTYDTHENRYVKMTLERLSIRIETLSQSIQKAKYKFNSKPDEEVINILNRMTDTISKKLKKPFWKNIGRLDRSVMSVVLQMATGYRDVYQIYATLSKGIVLTGEIYKMSIKDIALLYEYWTFLKLGKILKDKCEDVSHNLIEVKSDGLTLNLDGGAKRTFRNKTTGETIRLHYQYSTRKEETATVTQIPDTMLIIEKLGRDYDYMYIFDAKYRINFGNDESRTGPGPMEDDINTMHRYRDAIIAESDGRYERTAFGAYVLFPWNDLDRYEEHHLYKSIEKVNIGGLPFLPKATKLVEGIIDNLLNKTADELQEEGILPKGTKEFLYDDNKDYVLIVPVSGSFENIIIERKVKVAKINLPGKWAKAKKIALANANGIVEEGVIQSEEIQANNIVFHVEAWVSRFNPVIANDQSISEPVLIEEHVYNDAVTLPEMLITSNEQRQLWIMLKEKSTDVEIKLNTKTISGNSRIVSFKLRGHIFTWTSNSLLHEYGETIEEIPLTEIRENTFKVLSELAAKI
ncbi:restriction endonuclease-like protein [Ureibacillus acetophenoni]|uniref:DUF2357 domain-containing protein n=1 Tax=Ureibacillus acetophenoni TaxID=614649 RepID=A0A285UMJ4_9BACL|nr:restriction endonuclease-like protein [Ureibacillus acetophenoni]SOC41461.1 hypothetical protein SAMN05877842_11072 [Ureibacillus acetophenoni]